MDWREALMRERGPLFGIAVLLVLAAGAWRAQDSTIWRLPLGLAGALTLFVLRREAHCWPEIRRRFSAQSGAPQAPTHTVGDPPWVVLLIGGGLALTTAFISVAAVVVLGLSCIDAAEQPQITHCGAEAQLWENIFMVTSFSAVGLSLVGAVAGALLRSTRVAIASGVVAIAMIMAALVPFVVMIIGEA